jgi:aldose 1-epimerase
MNYRSVLMIGRSYAGVLLVVALIAVISAIPISSSSSATKQASKAKVEKSSFGKLADGTAVDLYKLTNQNGVELQIITYGGSIVSLKTPDRNGNFADIVLGYDEPQNYVDDTSYLGALIGRYANRIANGRFKLGGVEYKLAQNNGVNSLHGGPTGFHKRIWQAREVNRPNAAALEVSYKSKDGEEGFPGNLAVTTTFVLSNTNELRIEYSATTDKTTVVNLTEHAYFNLAGPGEGTILDHVLRINANRFTPVDENLIPTGELKSVKGTPLDFNKATVIGSRINQNDEQLIRGKGYDHNYVLNKVGKQLSLAAEVYEPVSGRTLQMWTTEPGVQFYSGNFLDNVRGKGSKVYQQRGGFCLEAQHFPDSPNKPAFPSTALRPNQRYSQTTVYKFSVRGATKS